METMQIFVPDAFGGSTVEAKVYRHITETFEKALDSVTSSPTLFELSQEGETLQDYRELTSPAFVLEHFRVVSAISIYQGTVKEWRCNIEAPDEIMQRFKIAQEVIK